MNAFCTTQGCWTIWFPVLSGKLEAGFPSSAWQWQRPLSYAPQVRGGRFQEPRDLWDGASPVPPCLLEDRGGGFPARCLGSPFLILLTSLMS